MRKSNERGVTVIELLIALAILSFVGILIWNVFIQGLSFSSKEMTKNQMQQEATIIISYLTKIHQTAAEEYEIQSNSCKISVTYNEEGQPKHTSTFENSKLCFEVKKVNETNGLPIITIDPFKSNISLSIMISDNNDPNNKITVNTLLSRLKGGE